jgi:hypothetical protein
VVGADDTVLVTGTGAAPWTRQHPGTGNLLAGISCLQSCIAVASGGAILSNARVSAGGSSLASSQAMIPPDGATTGTLTVTLKDGGGFPFRGDSISLTSSRGPIDTIVPAAASSEVTNSAGVATFKVRSGTPGTATFTATDTTAQPVVTLTQRVIVNFVSAGTYKPLVPARILDTRDGTGGVAASPLGSGGTLNVQIAGRGGVPATGVAAVVLNATVTNTTDFGYLTVWPAGVTRPLASNLNWVPGQTVPNLVEVAVGSAGQVSLYNFQGSTDVVFDVAGYVSTPETSLGPDGLFNPLVPARLMDTRDGTGGSGTLGAGATALLQVAGRGGVPSAGVSAVVLNVTVTGPTAPGFVTVWPEGASRPLASNLNFVPGQTVPNRVIVKTGTGGRVYLYNLTGSTDLVVDVGGYYTDATPGGSGTRFVGLTPSRILDTRDGTGGPGTIGPGGTIGVQVGTQGGVAANAKAVVANLTVTNPTGASFLTAWPSDAARPTASDLNFVPGQTVPNLVVVKLGADGKVNLYNLTGTTDAILDVVGYYI